MLPQFGALKDEIGRNSSFWKPRLVLQRRSAPVEMVQNCSWAKIRLPAVLVRSQCCIVLQGFSLCTGQYCLILGRGSTVTTIKFQFDTFSMLRSFSLTPVGCIKHKSEDVKLKQQRIIFCFSVVPS